MAPAAQITLVVGKPIVPIVELCPYVDSLVSFALPKGPVVLRNWTAIPKVWTLYRKHFYGRSFDLVIAPRWGPDYYGASMMSALIKAKRKVWFSDRCSTVKAIHNFGFDGLYTDSVICTKTEHEVKKSLRLLRETFGHQSVTDHLETWLSSEDRAVARVLLGVPKKAGKMLIAFGVGAKSPKRRWPEENYISLGRELCSRYDALLVIVRGPEDTAIVNALKERLGHLVAYSEIGSLRETAALIELCDLFVGNDSGPAHLAAACDIPVVVISCHPRCGEPNHDNSPLRFRPWCTSQITIQPDRPLSPCSLQGCQSSTAHCITEISAAEVFEASTRFISKWPQTRDKPKLRYCNHHE